MNYGPLRLYSDVILLCIHLTFYKLKNLNKKSLKFVIFSTTDVI